MSEIVLVLIHNEWVLVLIQYCTKCELKNVLVPMYNVITNKTTETHEHPEKM